ncbi:hypothetical protein pdam_00006924 [Pocillopora damicornis]|uniref:F5/8 type C domain-containing protein n=1 Tax=Pocillopora damicornis TaxID=46731 RepID=A0A3M6U9J0_POCDA|nr:hypothetical protein pdam_00006924 [Pocillopora damicornis]
MFPKIVTRNLKSRIIKVLHPTRLACNTDVSCRRINYVISRNMYELNDRTKEARSETFAPDTDRFYFRRDKNRIESTALYESRCLSKTRNPPTPKRRSKEIDSVQQLENLGRFKSHGNKPFLVNLQCVEYEFKCSLCGANYIGYTNRHLHLDIEEHKYSVIVSLGFLFELPRESCEEIKANEGRQAVIGMYWLKSGIPETPVHEFCNMESKVCKPMGVESETLIPDAQITASSHYMYYYAHKRRLNGNTGWCQKTSKITDDFIQVDMGVLRWVFEASKDLTTVVKNILKNPVQARYVRFQPLTFYSYPCVRIEIFAYY